MRRPLFGKRGVNAFVKLSRLAAQRLRRPSLAFDALWISRLMVLFGRRVGGRRVKWRDVVADDHGGVALPREFGCVHSALMTPDSKVHVASEAFVHRTRELLVSLKPTPPAGYPFYLGNRRTRHSMNSWLN